MQFPITRRRLQAYKNDEYLINETRQRIDKIVKYICDNIEKTVITSGQRKYIYQMSHVRELRELIQGKARFSDSNLPTQPDILEQVLDALKEKFIDCDIVVDPLETYILIDWS
jgi:hypothetical protein